jgi:uncharacterized protein
MQFNVAALLKEPTGATREYDIDDDLRVGGEKHRVTGHARLDRTPRGVLVRASISGTMSGECSRCLRPIDYPVEIALDEEYVPTIDVNTGAHVETDETTEDAYRISARHVLDLTEATAQYWALALPLAPVCSEDCAGLCPDCGADLAAGPHTCPAEQGDARWAKLSDLRRKQ